MFYNTTRDLKRFGLSFLITLFFFAVTYLVFPWGLYPFDYDKSVAATEVQATEVVPQTAIVAKAAQALFPWAILSPWSVVSQIKCKEIGCIALLFLVVPAVIGLFFIYQGFASSFLRRKGSGDRAGLLRFLKLSVLIWVIYVGVGVYTVKRSFIDTPLVMNNLLADLKSITGKKAFPDGTTFSIANVHFRRPDWYTEDVKIDGGGYYSKEQDQFLLYVLNKPLVQTVEIKCQPNEAFDIVQIYQGFWACYSKTDRYNHIYYGFLDPSQRILVQINRQPGSRGVPAFAEYYKR